MAGASPQGTGAGEVNAPLSQERLKGILDSQGHHWFVDKDGDLGGSWQCGMFYFIITGRQKEILHIQMQWKGTLPIDALDEVRQFIASWHREKLWPKCYHRIDDQGAIRISCENNVDWEYGATDSQLLQQIRCALATADSFCSALEKHFGVN